MSNTPNHHPLTPDFAAAVGRIRELADASADAMVTEGPVSRDRELLDICAQIGRKKIAAVAAFNKAHPGGRIYLPGTLERAEMDRLVAIYDVERRGLAHMLRAASKLKATTPAGIFAKALAIRSSESGANGLALSLAEDLTSNAGLRRVLWAPEREDAA